MNGKKMEIQDVIIYLKEIEDSGILDREYEDAVSFAISALDWMSSQGFEVRRNKK